MLSASHDGYAINAAGLQSIIDVVAVAAAEPSASRTSAPTALPANTINQPHSH